MTCQLLWQHLHGAPAAPPDVRNKVRGHSSSMHRLVKGRCMHAICTQRASTHRLTHAMCAHMRLPPNRQREKCVAVHQQQELVQPCQVLPLPLHHAAQGRQTRPHQHYTQQPTPRERHQHALRSVPRLRMRPAVLHCVRHGSLQAVMRAQP